MNKVAADATLNMENASNALAIEVSAIAHAHPVGKKRKTRRGKSKRKHPYRKSTKMIKPDAPHNSNQFLLEDHGDIEDLDENLKCDQISTRTRNSSYSVDSDGEFYSSPEDEDKFLIRDFDDQYEKVQAERLQNLSKAQLIQEYTQLESKIELLSKKSAEAVQQREIERLKLENERLKRENELLRQTTAKPASSDSEDSETDSTDSCSSTSSSSSHNSDRNRISPSPIVPPLTNGHSNSI